MGTYQNTDFNNIKRELTTHYNGNKENRARTDACNTDRRRNSAKAEPKQRQLKAHGFHQAILKRFRKVFGRRIGTISRSLRFELF